MKRGGGAGGLVGGVIGVIFDAKFELNPQRIPIWTWPNPFLTPKKGIF